jgi:predicted RNA-binding Zn-ribbon protein involved in translation (DUF1610 family)
MEDNQTSFGKQPEPSGGFLDARAEPEDVIEESRLDGSQPRPLRGPKAWIVLGVIFLAIAVAVLYVYQAGDRKTVLGNQPIPAVQLPSQVVPSTGNSFPVALNVPGGGRREIGPEGPPAPGQTGGAQLNCPVCHTPGLPICASCKTVMQPLGQGGLYACPTCGLVGLPICPRCGHNMSKPKNMAQHAAAVSPAQAVGGQFQCPACGATGLPNWDAAGVPICPSCGTRMGVR